MSSDRNRIRPVLALFIAAVALIYRFNTGYYGNVILAEIAIYAILAMSLDLLAGYAGMVSLGHAAFFAIGAYMTASLTVFWGWPALVAMPVAVLATAIAAVAIGIVAVRLSGIFFIMITLAIGQMVYSYLFKNRALGGDDGMSGTPRPDLSWLGVSGDDPAVFSLFVIFFAAAIYLFFVLLSRSPYGHTLVGIHQNENRMRALGCPVRRYKLSAYILSGAVAGLAGSLIAQQTGFVSPELAFWTVSGELLIMVIVGGLGTFIGPVIGAAIVIFLKHELSSLTEHWALVMGVFFVVVVLFTDNGFYGLVEKIRDFWRTRTNGGFDLGPAPAQVSDDKIGDQDAAG